MVQAGAISVTLYIGIPRIFLTEIPVSALDPAAGSFRFLYTLFQNYSDDCILFPDFSLTPFTCNPLPRFDCNYGIM